RPFHSKYRNVEDDAPAGQRMIEVDFDGALEDPAHYAGEMTAGGLEGDHHARLELHALEPAAVDELDVLGPVRAERLLGVELDLRIVARLHAEQRLLEAGQQVTVAHLEGRRLAAPGGIDLLAGLEQQREVQRHARIGTDREAGARAHDADWLRRSRRYSKNITPIQSTAPTVSAESATLKAGK